MPHGKYADKEKLAAKKKRWYERKKGMAEFQRQVRNGQYKRLYGITVEQYEQMSVAQGGSANFVAEYL